MVVGVVRVVAAFAAVLVLLLVQVSGASAATFERLSVSSGGAQGDGGSYAPVDVRGRALHGVRVERVEPRRRGHERPL